MTREALDDSIVQRIVKTFGDRGNWCRTPGGIARASGLSPDTVGSCLSAHPDLFTRSEITPGGAALYSLNVRAAGALLRV